MVNFLHCGFCNPRPRRNAEQQGLIDIIYRRRGSVEGFYRVQAMWKRFEKSADAEKDSDGYPVLITLVSLSLASTVSILVGVALLG
jgi:hypothetical protein